MEEEDEEGEPSRIGLVEEELPISEAGVEEEVASGFFNDMPPSKEVVATAAVAAMLAVCG